MSALDCQSRRQECSDVEIRTDSILRKPCTSSVVDGPPMFIKTIAVGPLEPGVACGATVALPLHCELNGARWHVAEFTEVARFAARVKGARRTIVGGRIEQKACVGAVAQGKQSERPERPGE